MKMTTKLLCLVIAVIMLFSLVACGNDNDNESAAESKAETSKVDEKVTPAVDPDTYLDTDGELDAEKLYDAVYADFYAAYAVAKEEKNVSKKFALMAIAEAKLMESAIMVPLTANGGNYAIGNVVPYSICSTAWGNDEYRLHNVIVANKTITLEDRNALKTLWAEVKGTGTYSAKAKEYLTNHGYTIKNTYNVGYSSEPEIFDVFLSSKATDAEVLVNTYDGLVEYDNEGTLQPALATSWSYNEDKTVLTFKLRQGVNWVDSTGAVYAEVKADDFLAGFQHMLDDPEGGLSWLVEGVIKGVSEYLKGEVDFSQVGVKAVDEYTVSYELVQETSYFDTMFSYGVFAPLCRAYYVSKNGEFGYGNASSENCTYGLDKDSILYCGPYLIDAMVATNTVVFKKNTKYWNAENVEVETITWIYNDGKVATQAYDDYVAGKIDTCGLNSASLAKYKAVNDGADFEKYAYVSTPGSSSYPGFYNLYRRSWNNCNDETALVSAQTDAQKEVTAYAMLNQNFRLAISLAFNRGDYMAASVGEDLKYVSMVNSYTPGTFVSLSEEVTVSINGTDKTYPAGTYYGAIMQDQIDADGYTMKVFDTTADGGVGSSAGYDGWYNPTKAVEYFEQAIKELAAAGIEVTAENPIHIDYPCQDDASTKLAMATAYKNSIESVLGNRVVVDLVKDTDRLNYLYATYYFNAGYQANYNVSCNSGWGPDYGDPSSYLDTMCKGGGYMLKCNGLDA